MLYVILIVLLLFYERGKVLDEEIKKTVFITRIKHSEKSGVDFAEDELLKGLIKTVAEFGIKKIYVINDKYNKECISPWNDIESKLHFIKIDNPASPVAMNCVLEKLQKINRSNEIEPLFSRMLIVSKEIVFNEEHLEALYRAHEKNENLLVSGYKFQVCDRNREIRKDLNNELQKYYKDARMAYIVPLNTFAMWNCELFLNKIKKYDEICVPEINKLNEIEVIIRSKKYKTFCSGMEDGLAIAKAVSNDKNIKYSLLDCDKDGPLWIINDEKIIDHQKKLARKNQVLKTFMVYREYFEEPLRSAKLED